MIYKNSKKAIAVGLVSILTIAILSGCSSSQENKLEFTSSPPSKITIEDVDMNIPYIIKIEDKTVSTDEYKYYFLNSKKNKDEGDSTYWDTRPEEIVSLKEKTVGFLKNSYSIAKLASEYGITLSDAEKKEIDNKIINIKEEYDKSGSVMNFSQFLYSENLTLEIYRQLSYEDAVEQKLMAKLCENGGSLYISDQDVKTKVLNEYYCMKQIFVAIDEEGKTENFDKIKEAKAKLDSGADFQTILDEYNRDSGMRDNQEGYYFAKGQMFENIEQAYLKLEVGQYSDIIKTEKGYHIVLRKTVNEEHVNNNISQFAKEIQEKEFNDLINKKSENLKVEYFESYEKFGVNAFN